MAESGAGLAAACMAVSQYYDTLLKGLKEVVYPFKWLLEAHKSEHGYMWNMNDVNSVLLRSLRHFEIHNLTTVWLTPTLSADRDKQFTTNWKHHCDGQYPFINTYTYQITPCNLKQTITLGLPQEKLKRSNKWDGLLVFLFIPSLERYKYLNHAFYFSAWEDRLGTWRAGVGGAFV